MSKEVNPLYAFCTEGNSLRTNIHGKMMRM